MKFPVLGDDGKTEEEITLEPGIFALKPRVDIIHSVIRWQLAKRRAGTHAVKNRADIARTGKKMYKQKGTGRARHGSGRVNIFRGGGRAFGPTPRDHGHKLPKKIRALGLCHALSAKLAENELAVWAKMPVIANSKSLKARLDSYKINDLLLIDTKESADSMRLAARNIPHVDILPVAGINVYDIMRRKHLILTKDAVKALEERLK